MKRIAILAAAALALAAHAEFKTGNNLLSDIKGDPMDYVHGNGYVIGVYDATQHVMHCPPPGVTAGQVVDMVRLYLEANPQERHRTADVLVLNVLQRAWPCQQRTQPRGGSSL